MFAAGIVMGPETRRGRRGGPWRRSSAALAAYETGSAYLNFVEQPVDAATFYTDEAYARLRAIRAAVDPDGRMVANHRIPAE